MAPRPCFQKDRITHEKRNHRQYSHSTQFGIGLEEKFWEELEFVPIQASAGRKKTTQRLGRETGKKKQQKKHTL